MQKPQQMVCNDHIFMKSDYPELMERLEEYVSFNGGKRIMDEIYEMVEIAYKAGYVDAWKEALFFTDNL